MPEIWSTRKRASRASQRAPGGGPEKQLWPEECIFHDDDIETDRQYFDSNENGLEWSMGDFEAFRNAGGTTGNCSSRGSTAPTDWARAPPKLTKLFSTPSLVGSEESDHFVDESEEDNIVFERKIDSVAGNSHDGQSLSTGTFDRIGRLWRRRHNLPDGSNLTREKGPGLFGRKMTQNFKCSNVVEELSSTRLSGDSEGSDGSEATTEVDKNTKDGQSLSVGTIERIAKFLGRRHKWQGIKANQERKPALLGLKVTRDKKRSNFLEEGIKAKIRLSESDKSWDRSDTSPIQTSWKDGATRALKKLLVKASVDPSEESCEPQKLDSSYSSELSDETEEFVFSDCSEVTAETEQLEEAILDKEKRRRPNEDFEREFSGWRLNRGDGESVIEQAIHNDGLMWSVKDFARGKSLKPFRRGRKSRKSYLNREKSTSGSVWSQQSRTSRNRHVCRSEDCSTNSENQTYTDRTNTPSKILDLGCSGNWGLSKKSRTHEKIIQLKPWRATQ